MKTCSECGFNLSASDKQCPQCGAKVNGHEDRLIGTTLADKYLIEDHLGSGGMCDVYRAQNTAMGKQVAVKVLKAELAADPKIAERFEQEARAASRIHHPHAINVTDYGIDRGNRPFIVMELVKGQTLGEMLRSGGAFSVERAANILRQACGALEAAHSVGVIHRDIKPDNIIIANYDGSDWVEVVDFGVAKIQEDVNRRSALTGANIIVGTPRYMSPEQCEEKPVDARSDIYSLGVVLYEMLSGEAPFEGDSSTRMLMAHASEPPAPLSRKRPDISPEVEAVVMSALEKDPERRPQSASEFTREFEQAAGLAEQGTQPGPNRGGAFSRISVPLGQQPPAPSDAQPSEPDSEATIVRQRPASQSGANTPSHQRADTAYGTRPFDSQAEEAALVGAGAAPVYSTPSQGVTYVTGSRGYSESSNTGLIIGAVTVLLIVVGVAAFLIFGDRLYGGGGTGDPVIDAQQAITEAVARVDSLPGDHPLRSYLPQLAQWQGELRAYQQLKEYNTEITATAERYQKRAEEISGQARAALASLSREAANSSTANRELNNNATTATSETGVATQPGEADQNKNAAGSQAAEETPQEDQNKNKNERAAPPAVEPVQPTPPSSRPANSNRPKNENSNRPASSRPPQIERIEMDGAGALH